MSTPDLNSVQGDILVGGFPKKTETYLFFKIAKVPEFKKDLAEFAPLVKSTADVLKDRKDIQEHKKRCEREGKKPDLIPLVGVNISFSRFGLDKLGISSTDIDALKDTSFSNGQFKDSFALGDKGEGTQDSFEPDWDPAFKEKLDGIILVAGESHLSVTKKLAEIKHIFGVGTHKPSINEIKSISGDVRPDEEAGHEHFGFLDGISNPAIIGVDEELPQVPKPIRPGFIVAGRDGDIPGRPAWALDGSFLVFRYLFQLVPEFDSFLEEHPVPDPRLTKQEAIDLRGARMVGRWKSGTPIECAELAPLKDDPEIAKDPKRTRRRPISMPFAAHIRKTLPRADLEDKFGDTVLESRRIMRRGIQFGPEVTPIEKAHKRSQHGRGLLFVCYQSSIDKGFHFIQQSWANAESFPPGTSITPGFDAIIGQAGGGGARQLSGTNPLDVKEELTLPHEFIVTRGGEYFFTPSIKALKETFSGKATA
nr:DyP-type peroxidase [Chondrostereum purpureum]